jgi:UPF0042 nucleotide-binding protein
MSGSGKTLALKALEDMGYFSIDNLPVPLIVPFIELLDRGEDRGRGALVVDVRERRHLESLPEAIAGLRCRQDVSLTLLYLEARDETLVKRFQASRRPHPLGQAERGSLSDSIAREREVLARLREASDRVIGTDDMSPHDLRRLIQDALREGADRSLLHCQVVSFGFKHGSVRDADMVFDSRFLENPYFVDSLKNLTGLDQPVIEYLESQPDYAEFIDRLEAMISFVLPRIVHEGKSYLTIGIGCTGGRHRSVAIAEHLGRFICGLGFAATVHHRDLRSESEAGR